MVHPGSRGKGQPSVSNEKCERQKPRGGQTHVKAADDVRNNRTQNIGQHRDDKKSEEDQTDCVAASRHELQFSSSIQDAVEFAECVLQTQVTLEGLSGIPSGLVLKPMVPDPRG